MLNAWTVLEKVVPFVIEQLKKKKSNNSICIFLGQPMHDCLHLVHLHKEQLLLLHNSATVSRKEPCSHTDMENTAYGK